MVNYWRGFIVLCLFADVSLSFALPWRGIARSWDEEFRLDIIHFNDFHARFEETAVSSPVCNKNDSSCLGGFARLYAAIKRLKLEKPDALILNAGDCFQGTYWYTLLKWKITEKFMNLLPIDAHAIGNHEFDDGVKGLAPYLASLKAPVLAANINASETPELLPHFRPYIILDRRGRRIGIIGLITPDTEKSSSPGNVKFGPCQTAAKEYAKDLNDIGVDIIVVLSHCGLTVDRDIARNYGEHIDIIVGGHSHSLLWNGKSPTGEPVESTYPVIIEGRSKTDNKVVIVQASAFTKVVGNLSVWFDTYGNYMSWEGNPILLDRSIQEDQSIKRMMEPFSTILHGMLDQKVTEIDNDLSAYDCGFGECLMGNIVADAFRNVTMSLYKPSLPCIALVARGNIREGISQGPVTRGDIVNTLPYDNDLVTFKIEGTYILDILEQGLERTSKNGTFYLGLVHFSGLQIAVNMTRPSGSRVYAAAVLKGPETREPLVLTNIYQVATGSFVASHNQIIMNHKMSQETLTKDRSAVETYLRYFPYYNAKLDQRLIIEH